MNELPKDLAGYQHLSENQAARSDDLMVLDGKPVSFVGVHNSGYGTSWIENEQCVRVYRKIPCPGNRDDKAMWGEKPVVHVVRDTADVIKELLEPTFPVKSYISQDDKARKNAPMFRGLLGYFPAALFEIATHSMESDLKHNPGNVGGPTWARKKSSDHADCIVRHLIDAGAPGTPDRIYHLRALAWRACAMLQEECESNGAMPGISSRY